MKKEIKLNKIKILIIILIILFVVVQIYLIVPFYLDDEPADKIPVRGELEPKDYNKTSDTLRYDIKMNDTYKPQIYNSTGKYKMWVEVKINENFTKDVKWEYIDTNNDSYISTNDSLIIYNASKYLNKNSWFILQSEGQKYTFYASADIKKPEGV